MMGLHHVRKKRRQSSGAEMVHDRDSINDSHNKVGYQGVSLPGLGPYWEVVRWVDTGFCLITIENTVEKV